MKTAMDETTLAMRIQRRLRPKQPDNFGVLSSDTILNLYNQATAGIFAILIGVVSLSLVVGGIVIMNIMLMVVTERTREIGLRKSLGARRRDVMWQILTESVTLSTFGGVVGTAARVPRSPCPAMRARWTPFKAIVEIWSVVARRLDDGHRRAVLRHVSGHARGEPRADRSAEAGVERTSMRWALFSEIVVMSWDTLRGNKMRSFLTVLGIVIGITSIVGMTSLVRGFDESLQGFDPDDRAATRSSSRRSRSSASRPARPHRADEAAEHHDRRRRCARAQRAVDRDVSMIMSAMAGGPRDRVYFRNQKSKTIQIIGTTEQYPSVTRVPIEIGRFFTAAEVQHRRPVVVLGQALTRPCSRRKIPSARSSARAGRIRSRRRDGEAPQPGGLGSGVDDFVIIPQTTYQKQFGVRANNFGRGRAGPSCRSRAVRGRAARPGDARDRGSHAHAPRPAPRPAERLDLVTQDAVLKVWDQISSATFLTLIVLSSIALMVGGIGVMSIMTISVTERTREIGVRKALGARRVEILWQFLLEAVFLTSAGGLLGIAVGSAIGMSVHLITSFPVSLPWWSFAIGIGFSAASASSSACCRRSRRPPGSDSGAEIRACPSNRL